MASHDYNGPIITHKSSIWTTLYFTFIIWKISAIAFFNISWGWVNDLWMNYSLKSKTHMHKYLTVPAISLLLYTKKKFLPLYEHVSYLHLFFSLHLAHPISLFHFASLFGDELSLVSRNGSVNNSDQTMALTIRAGRQNFQLIDH